MMDATVRVRLPETAYLVGIRLWAVYVTVPSGPTGGRADT